MDGSGGSFRSLPDWVEEEFVGRFSRVFFILDFWDVRPKKGRSPIENSGTSGDNPDLGSGGGLGAPFLLEILRNEYVTRNLCRSTLLHLGVVAFRIHFGKIRKPIIFMIFGPGGCDHDCENQLYSTLETPNYFK